MRRVVKKLKRPTALVLLILGLPILISTSCTSDNEEAQENTIVETDYPKGRALATLSYVHPERYDDVLEVSFGTAMESANFGFNIYTVNGDKWTRLNETPYPGALDSIKPEDYRIKVALPKDIKMEKVGISGVDVHGIEERYGAFEIGEKVGERVKVERINWNEIRAQIEKIALKQVKRISKYDTREKLKNEKVIFKVSEDVVYRVTHDELMMHGIDLQGFNESKIAITFNGEGVPRLITGTSKRGRWTKESEIVFEGKAPKVRDALYIDANHYRLVLNKKQVVAVDSIEPDRERKFVIESNKEYSISEPMDDPFYEGYFYTRSAGEIGRYEINFDLPFALVAGTTSLRFDTAVTTYGSHTLKVLLNGGEITTAHSNGVTTWPIEVTVDNGLLLQSGNKVEFQLVGESDGVDVVMYDKLTITHSSGEPFPPKSLTIKTIEKVKKRDVRVNKKTDYLIIAHPLFINETLEHYISVRQNEGWRVEVVNVEDIYAAYTDGMKLPDAIENYLKYAIQRGVTHVQLVGAASYDYHDYLGLGSMSFIPSIYASTYNVLKYTPCDGCYVMGDDQLPQIAIGRWPVRTVEELENVINKTLAWEPTRDNALLIADKTYSGGLYFDRQMELFAGMIEEKGWQSIERVYLDDFIESHNGNSAAANTAARESIQQKLNAGKDIVSYNGHGTITHWSTSKMLAENDIAGIDNSGMAPVALGFGCMVTYAEGPYNNTMAHQLISSGENGAVALYGASTYSTYYITTKTIGKVFERLVNGETLGEAVLNKKRALGTGFISMIKNNNILGDVTLKLK